MRAALLPPFGSCGEATALCGPEGHAWLVISSCSSSSRPGAGLAAALECMHGVILQTTVCGSLQLPRSPEAASAVLWSAGVAGCCWRRAGRWSGEADGRFRGVERYMTGFWFDFRGVPPLGATDQGLHAIGASPLGCTARRLTAIGVSPLGCTARRLMAIGAFCG